MKSVREAPVRGNPPIFSCRPCGSGVQLADVDGGKLVDILLAILVPRLSNRGRGKPRGERWMMEKGKEPHL